ncbi:MAG: tRNA 2-thiouridine(34) synthase MnmA [Candidatus Brennerbacteria bacterium CG11_big_fil_rev_8_21_14_0_20_43_10]|uniref:tRNA-specific 2-thiouridylase MnmA n=3 Tax=Candidatus Brenneribacteriota TaxID=1817902 RepID=A0A2M8C3R7_9BACT|nr:MAG: tRNA 2-thiouridine(34) synthase MnmA [Parcubacteria group bacterium CG1_02_44_31]PIP50504.1 MAG: tRNA 2-thiouridine(34) synthase MnmA [Candidatus Brennerbacteria bacterium CG23_combo_of_CG06-09_8_20_14_all_44_41]PIR26589.1 MAG: tRNA 2-thiouridine(34) synthase MnmA [Candidatus Brennerbacteria bacterium CG11_big_fil_rev_8_21_14_0_20_43_10]PIX28859.1 MAG: tRNA 2-thiouridine(34) synthase MnmA [Candidatus Brennerbacteria bacterium CG_4_8_14_3_um_filter_43_14]PJA19609.1 MAG: tRNA 2-thiouridin
MGKNNKKIVFVAMSGGVDSSVAALLLKKQGYNVVGVYMKNWSESKPGVVWCTWEQDQRFAREAASQINIPFYTWDFEKEYRGKVFDYFVRGYRKGETPNPDVMCNKEIKFGLFLKKALSLGANYIATGHYVRLKSTNSESLRIYEFAKKFLPPHSFIRKLAPIRYSLIVAKDNNKDQSYFLWTLTQKQLRYCLFPIGDYIKPEVRALAKRHGLINAERKDSQGLCFVGKVKFNEFLQAYVSPKQGDIIQVIFDAQGKRYESVVGMHQGVQFYTIGQRHGIRIAAGEPYYIVAKCAKTNTLYVSFHKYVNRFFDHVIRVHNIHWISSHMPHMPFSCMARYRYRQPLQEVTVMRIKGKTAVVKCAKVPVGIASGQSIVFYQGQKMLGGGVIAT